MQREGVGGAVPIKPVSEGVQQLVRIVSNSALAQQHSISNITRENRDLFRTYASSAAARQMSGTVTVRRKGKAGDATS